MTTPSARRERVRLSPLVRGVLLVAVAALLLAGSSSVPAKDEAGSEGVIASLTAQIEIERQLLVAERARYRSAAAARDAAAARLSAQLPAMDASAAGTGADASAEALEIKARELAAAEQQRTAAAARCAEAVGQIRIALDRIRLFDQRIALLKGRRKPVEDVLTGRWDVTYSPTGETGVFDLKQDGTLLTGQYTLRLPDQPVRGAYEPVVPSETGQARLRSGSLQGTFASGKVSIQRIDAKTGKSSELEGWFQGAGGAIRGTWQKFDLADGRTQSGSWTAVRQDE